MNAQLTVLVTDPEQRASLAAVRSLGRRGHRVLTVGRSRGLAGHSRFVQEHVPVAVHEDLAAAVRAAVRRHDVQVVLPVTDASSRLLLGLEAELGARLAGPDAAAYDRASDKDLLMRLAPTVGIRVPGQNVVATPLDVGAAVAAVSHRAVVKPSRSVAVIDGKTQRFGVRYVETADRLPSVLAAYPAEAYPLLVQEWCLGVGEGVFLLRTGQPTARRTLVCAGHRRLREKPPSGGVSTYRESTTPEPELVTRCEALLDALEYSGPAMVEFKRDERTGVPVLMEINARLWGSVHLAVIAGADFPSAVVAWATGQTVDTCVARPGVRCAWELGEVDHMLALMRGTPESLHLPPDAPTGARGAWQALLARRLSDRGEVLMWHDPRPFGAELMQWIRNLL